MTPEQVEAHVLGGGVGSEDYRETRASNSAVPLPPVQGRALRCDPKIVASLKARCALIGVAMHFVDDDRGHPLFIVSRWSLTRQLHSVDEVETFLRRAGGPDA